MKTESEKKTELMSKKVFLPEFVDYSLKFEGDNGEEELCDCLLTFQNAYTVVEVKERDQKFIKKSNTNWFKNAVEKTAVNQIVKAYKLIKNADNIHFYNDLKNTICLKSNFEIFPVIVFDNPQIKDYKRVIHCSRINSFINVFSMDDFNRAFDTLLIPYEINLYLSFRINILKENDAIFRSKLIIGDFENKTILWGGGIKSDFDLAQYYYGARSNVAEPNKIEEKLYLFNKISNHIRDSLDSHSIELNMKKEIVSFVNSVDINGAYDLASKWEKCVNRCHESDNAYNPFYFLKDKCGLIFMVKSKTYNKKDFMDFSSLLMTLYSYKRHLNSVYLIGFCDVNGETETMISCKKFEEFEYPNKEFEETILKYEQAGLKI